MVDSTFWYNTTPIVQNFDKQLNAFMAENRANLATAPQAPVWFFNSPFGVPRSINAAELRQYSKSAWVQMVKRTIKNVIMNTDYVIKAVDPNDKNDYSKDIDKVNLLLKYPNRNGQSFWELWGTFLDDVMDLDAGVIWKGRNAKGEVVELFAYDGSRFLIQVDKKGIIENYWQYSYIYPNNSPLGFNKEDIIYGKLGVNTELFPYGFSPLQSIQQVVEVMIQSDRYNKEFFQNNAVPDALVSIMSDQDNMERFKAYWETELKGKAHKLLFHNSEMQFTPLAISNKDMQWLDGQKWYFHVVFGAYGLSPNEVGFYDDVNRASSESQERVTVKNAVRPFFKLIQDKVTREIIPEVVGHDKLMLDWVLKDDQAEKLKHDQDMQKLQQGVITINEMRQEQGLDPVEWGDKPLSVQRSEQFAQQSQQQQNNPQGQQQRPSQNSIARPQDGSEDDEEEETQKKKSFDIPENIVTKSEDKIDEEDAEPYVSMLRKEFSQWESQIMSFVDTELNQELVQKDGELVNKSLIEFLRRMINIVNSAKFRSKIEVAVKKVMNSGIEEAEAELNVDVGFDTGFQDDVRKIAERQLSGFRIEDKQWGGIKGVTQEMQEEIRQYVIKGVSSQESLTEIKRGIRDIFTKNVGGTRVTGDVTEGRLMTIARTESNRIKNYARIQTFDKSGLAGRKVWDSFLDNRTSEICERLNNQSVEKNDNFVDPLTGNEYSAPPSHPNCRSTVRFELDD